MKKNSVPIFFTHGFISNRYNFITRNVYLKKILEWNNKLDLSLEFIFATDKETIKSIDMENFKNIKIIETKDYENKGSKLLTENYLHLSSNNYLYELYCLRRYFYALDYCNKNQLKRILLSDYDNIFLPEIKNLLYDNKLLIPFLKCTKKDNIFDNKYRASGGLSIWNKKDLESYCSYLLNSYTKEYERKKLIKYYKNFKFLNIKGGITDMYHLSKWLSINEPYNLINLRNAAKIYKYEFDPSIEENNNSYKTITYFSFNKMGTKTIKKIFIYQTINNSYKYSYSNLLPLTQIQLQGDNKGIIWLISNFNKYKIITKLIIKNNFLYSTMLTISSFRYLLYRLFSKILFIKNS